MPNENPSFEENFEAQKVQADTFGEMEDSIEVSNEVTILPEAYIQLDERYRSIIDFFRQWKEKDIDKHTIHRQFWLENSDLKECMQKIYNAQTIITNHWPKPNENIVLTQEESKTMQNLYNEIQNTINDTMRAMVMKLEDWQESEAQSIMSTITPVLTKLAEMRNIVQSGTTVY